jgi:hypothetical protein
MKTGCAGCLHILVGLALTAVLLGAAIGVTARALARPDAPPSAPALHSDGVRAQHKLVQLFRAEHRPAAVSLSEAEINALLARHVMQARGIHLGTAHARLVGDDRIELTTRMPLRELLDNAGGAVGTRLLPASWQERPVWMRVRARVTVEARGPRQLRGDVEAFALGRQRLPVVLMRLVMDPAIVGLLRWPLPAEVTAVTIEPGRVVIKTTS